MKKTNNKNKSDNAKKNSNLKSILYILCPVIVIAVTVLVIILTTMANFDYELSAEDGGYIISSYSGRKANLIIPEEYSTLPVVGISDSVFEGNRHLRSVTVPSSVEKIGAKAFASCEKLKSVTLSEGLTSIGTGCFENTSLESIVIPEGIKKLISGEFLNCKTLKSVTLPSTLEETFHSAFMNCESLSEIKINGTSKTYKAVDNCLIDIENKTLVIGSANSVIPTDGSVTAIGEYAFFNRTSLTDIIIPEAVDTIGECAFYGCTSLKSIQALGAASIGSAAFRGCSSATYAILSDKLTNVENFAIFMCPALKNIYFEGDSAAWEKIDRSEAPNGIPTNVPVSFYSEKAPAGEGSFWHFDENGAPVIWN